MMMLEQWLKAIVASILLATVIVLPAGAELGPDERVLLIAIDSIPYRLVEELVVPTDHSPGLFAGLDGPAAVINTFPSTSFPAWSGLFKPFGVEVSDGYIGRYFDWQTRNLADSSDIGVTIPPWRDFFDWRMTGIRGKVMAYGWARSNSRREIRDGLDAFMASDKPIFTMYIFSTDGIGHIHGMNGLREFLVDLDNSLAELRQKYNKGHFYTVLLSDHGIAGGSDLQNIWPDVRAAVDAGGFSLGSSITDKDDAVVITLGLVSDFGVYTEPERKQEMAGIVSQVKGVDLCVVQTGQEWQVTDAAGSAIISRRVGSNGTEWRYTPGISDPLSYLPILDRLRRRDPDANRWYPDEWWFAETASHNYPDALHRLAASFTTVRNPATVACSLEPGYMFGGRAAQIISKPFIGNLKWTHGALFNDAAIGFLMTDMPGWQEKDVLRYEDALQFVVDESAGTSAVTADAGQ